MSSRQHNKLECLIRDTEQFESFCLSYNNGSNVSTYVNLRFLSVNFLFQFMFVNVT